MRILTINCTYDTGSTGKIVQDIKGVLRDNTFIQFYEVGPKSNTQQYRIAGRLIRKAYYFWGRITGLKHSTGIIPTRILISKIKKINPDIVHIHCPFGNVVNIPQLIQYLNRSHTNTLITNHAEFFYTANCSYAFECKKFVTGCGNCKFCFDSHRRYLFDRTAYEWQLMQNAYYDSKNIYMACVSPWVQQRLLLSPLTKHIPSRVILNGINTKVFHYCDSDAVIQKEYIFHVTSGFSDEESDIKGGHYILDIARRLPKISIVVAGSVCLSDGLVIPSNITLLGSVSDQNVLADYYRNATLTVITSRRETFGMACAESLCCGTPVVGFNAGGPETISIKKYSEFVEYGDVDSLIKTIIKWKSVRIDKDEISKEAVQLYSSQRMAEQYNDYYNYIMNNRS